MHYQIYSLFLTLDIEPKTSHKANPSAKLLIASPNTIPKANPNPHLSLDSFLIINFPPHKTSLSKNIFVLNFYFIIQRRTFICIFP